MTRKNKLIVLVSYLLMLTAVMIGYRINRNAKMKKLRADLVNFAADQSKASNLEAEAARLARLIPSETNSATFVESLYRCARESGIKQHNVATEGAKNQATARPGTAAASSIAKHIIKVSASGSYRNFAEYLRRVQNIERFNRITEYKLVPDGEQLKGTFTIELYSLSVQNAK